MKSKKEIEQLATEYSAIGKEAGLTHREFTLEKIGFKNGYTQCQEDMADKKYTEEDIRKAIMVGIEFEAGDYPEGFNYKLGMSIEDYFIESLNKQD